MRKRIMVIDCSVNTLKTIKKLGIKVICIEKEQKKQLKDLLKSDDIYYEIDYKDITLLKKEVGKILIKYPVDAILSFTGDGQNAVVALQEEYPLNKYKQSEQIKLFKNQCNLRNFLNRNNFSYVNVKLINSKEALIEFANENGFPFILKPCIETGSKVAKKISTFKEVYEFLDKENPTTLIAEDYQEGVEISVETFSFNRKHFVVGITDKYTESDFVTYGHSVPTTLKDELITEITLFVLNFLTLTGVVFGPCHIEIKITAYGPKIIAAHCRTGGDQIVALHHFVSGIDLIQWTLDAIYTENWQKDISQQYPAAAVIFFRFQPNKKIKKLNIQNVDETIVAYKCNIEEGDVTKGMNSPKDKHGYIIAKGRNVEEAVENCRLAIQTIEIEYAEEIYRDSLR
ncbi:ATP-grasp domain-containing protein [Lysinibacillus sphaericus]|uniref:ATP-grasp domain-containing protein n=1 Tax=Lysinibacillus sphaericus TaxID=1421 RepID=UPI003D7F7995